jgi:protocatechuate 3,4-dioxygenase beta subunit
VKPRKPALLIALFIAVLGAMFFGLRGNSDSDNETDPTAAHLEGEGPSTKTDPWKDRKGVPTEASGRVRAEEGGGAIADALVVLRPTGLKGQAQDESESLIARTDASGAWHLPEVASGNYQLSATASGYRPGTLPEVQIAARGKNEGINVELSAGGNHLHGLVQDVTGGPVEGALVRVTGVHGLAGLRDQQSFVVATASDGSYSAQAGNGRLRVSVWHPDYAPTNEIIEVKDSDRKTDFSLVPMGVIEGVVLSSVDGKAIPGANVSYMRERSVDFGAGKMSMPDQSGSTEADENGRFRIRGLNSGAIQLEARARGLGMTEPISVPLSLAEQASGIELFVSPASTVFGRVVVAGEPESGVSGASISLMSGMRSDNGSTADEEGYFELHGLAPGNYGLMVSHPDFLPVFPPHSIEVSNGDLQDVVVEVKPGATIRGRVEPATLAEVKFKIDPKGMGVGIGMGMMMLRDSGTSTDPSTGEFEFKAAMPGAVTLEAQTEDGRAGQVTVQVGEEGAQDVVIQLEDRARVAGTITDSKGRPVAGALVNLRAAQSSGVSMTVIVNGKDMTASSAPTAEDGRYEVTGLEAGSYELSITGPRGDALPPSDGVTPAVELAEGEAKTGVNLVVESSDGVIRGLVRTAEGDPAPDIWVTATKSMAPPTARKRPEGGSSMHSEAVIMMGGAGMGSGPRIAPILTNAEGRFEFTQLSDGAYSVSVDGDGGGSHATADGVEPDADVTLTLAPLGTVEGSVVANGQPVGDYSLRLSGPSQRSTRVREADGKFSVDRLDPGEYQVEVSTPDGTGGATVVVRAGETAHADIRLDRMATVTGTVVDKSGQPIMGARVVIGEIEEGGGVRVEISGDDPVNSTGEDGSFEASCAEGNRLLLIMNKDTHMPLAQKKFMARSGEVIDLGKIQEEDMSGMMGGPPGEAANEDVEVGDQP